MTLDALERRELFAIDMLYSPLDVDSNGGNEAIADVAMFADGSFVTVFTQGSTIFARRFGANKAPLGAQFAVATSTSNLSYSSPKVAAADESNFVVAYTELDLSNSDEDVFFKLYSGTSVVTSGKVNSTDEAKSQNSPSVAMADDGRFVVAYQHEYDASDEDVYFRVYDSSGAPLNSATLASGAGSSSNEIRSSVAMSGDGTRFGMAWQRVRDTGNRDSVRFTMYSLSGSTIATVVTNQQIPDANVGTNHHESPSVAMDANGDLAVAWIEDIAGNEQLWKRTFRPTGTGYNSVVVAGPASSLSNPRIAVGTDALKDYAIAYQLGEDVRVAGVTDEFDSFNIPVSNFSWVERNPQIDMQGQGFTITYVDRFSSQNNAKVATFGQSQIPGRNGNDIGGFIAASGAVYLGVESPSHIASYAPSLTWVDAITADFDNDGYDELAMRAASTGEWWITSDSGTPTRWTTWAPSANWVNVQAADINGDRLTDLIGRTSSGAWYAALSTGTSFNNVFIGAWAPSANWQDVMVGDFNGDFRDDIIGRIGANGQWWMGRSTGSTSAPSLTNILVGNWAPVAWTNLRVGDFNGDDRDDIIGQFNGQWWVGVSTGSSLTTSSFGVWSGAVTWNDVLVGDFNQDGRDDIAARVGSSGAWWVGVSNGTSFVTQNWANWAGNSWTHIRVLDANGDGRNDIAGWDASSGNWWYGISTGKKFVSVRWGTWSNAVTWNAVRSGSF